MAHKFAEIAFTDSVRAEQEALGSRSAYASMDEGDESHHRLGPAETDFIGARDSFYMATVSETGWPYLQHRGGPAGFVRVLDPGTIGFADFTGNRQYVTVGNVRKDNRVALFFMDYPNRTRLKLLGRVRLIGPDEPERLAQLEMDDYRAQVERGFIIEVAAFDWNCPQHITPRFTESEIDARMAPLAEENRRLKAVRDKTAVPPVVGDGPLHLVISGVRQLTPRIRAYELRDPRGALLPMVEAGAHLQIPIPLGSGRTTTRPYSICSDPMRRDHYEIAVLREEAGRGGSQALHAVFGIGMELHCGLPDNHFALHTDPRPAVLVAGGIGITPIRSMAHALQRRGVAFQLHYAARSETDMAFGPELRQQLGDAARVYQSDTGERMPIDRILADAPGDALFYVCGPSRLIDAFSAAAAAAGIDPERLRSERFGAAAGPNARPLQLNLRRSRVTLAVAADQGLLDAMLDAGIDAPFGCRSGTCKSCALCVLEGEPDHRDSVLSPLEREQDRLFCPCVSRAAGEHLTLDI